MSFNRSKLSFWSKKAKFLLKSSQKRQILQIGRRNPFQNGIGWISRQFWYTRWKKNIYIIPSLEPTRGLFSTLQKIRNFGSPVGILGASTFRNFGSPKIRNNGSAPTVRAGKISWDGNMSPSAFFFFFFFFFIRLNESWRVISLGKIFLAQTLLALIPLVFGS